MLARGSTSTGLKGWWLDGWWHDFLFPAVGGRVSSDPSKWNSTSPFFFQSWSRWACEVCSIHFPTSIPPPPPLQKWGEENNHVYKANVKGLFVLQKSSETTVLLSASEVWKVFQQGFRTFFSHGFLKGEGESASSTIPTAGWSFQILDWPCLCPESLAIFFGVGGWFCWYSPGN